MGKLLYEVKGSSQGQAVAKSEIQAAADAILQPLMDLLDGIFSKVPIKILISLVQVSNYSKVW